jgi:hypothetical protein
MSAPYDAEHGLHAARPMKQLTLRRTLSALPIFVLAAIAIVVSVQSIGCGDDCKSARGGSTQCD